MTSIVKQVLSLQNKSSADLQQLWRNLYHTEPPYPSKAYLIPRLAYRLQELSLGAMSPPAQKTLENLVDQMAKGKRGKVLPSSPALMKGTTLVRDWQGVSHCVTVMEGGFEYRGQKYKSLSAIARTITGTQWNGWVFFGVKSLSHKKALS